MDSPELEALAVKLHGQIDRHSDNSETPKVELEDVRAWIALQTSEAECCSEPAFFLNLV